MVYQLCILRLKARLHDATKTGLFVTFDSCCKKVSCDSMQQSHVAQIRLFTQHEFVAHRMFLLRRVNTLQLI